MYPSAIHFGLILDGFSTLQNLIKIFDSEFCSTARNGFCESSAIHFGLILDGFSILQNLIKNFDSAIHSAFS